MISIQHTCNRAEKTRDAQVSLAANPGWLWSRKTIQQWSDDLTFIEQLKNDESAKRVQWRNAAESWWADTDQIQSITRQVKAIGSVQFAADPIKKQAFEELRSDAEGRVEIYEQGVKARDTWQEYSLAWEIVPSILTLSVFSSLLANSLARKTTHGTKETSWRRAEATLMFQARQLHPDNVDWYKEATQRFAKDTVPGALIRTTVPTSYRPDPKVGQAVISDVIASNGTIHADCSAPHATSYTWLQLSPGAPAFVVVLADATETHITLNGQVAGLHKLKCIGRNSRGDGPESAIVEVTVAVAAVA